jgi:hypothetical protein
MSTNAQTPDTAVTAAAKQAALVELRKSIKNARQAYTKIVSAARDERDLAVANAYVAFAEATRTDA